MKVTSFVFGSLVGLLIGIIIIQPPEPDPEVITEYKTVTKTEFIKINQTEPMEMVTTAYTSGYESTGKRPGDKGYGITFTGTVAGPGTCAVDPEYIPLGSSLYVEDYGYCRALDTGSKVKGYHIDVYMDKVSDALEFGRKKRKVWILSNYGEEEPDADQRT